MPRVATIQDISGIGRCSLTAAIPILSAMGIQPCPLPTAVLSNQTAFESYAAVPLTGQLADSIAEWKKQGLTFEGVTTGFLMDSKQAGLVEDFIRYAKSGGALVVVDPVMGDGGRLYPVFDEDMCEAFRRLIAGADVITPNLTEACLLARMPYPKTHEHDFIWRVAACLADMGPGSVVITGVDAPDGQISNLAYIGGERIEVYNRKLGGHFSGTGDILSSVICGCLLRGENIEHGLTLAGQLFEAAIKRTLEQGADPREGVVFEPFLGILSPKTVEKREGYDRFKSSGAEG